MSLFRISLVIQWLWLSICVSVGMTSQLPYNPARILRSENRLYIFQPSSSSPQQFQLSSIDIASRIIASNLSHTTLYHTLPFLSDDAPRTFTPICDNAGNILVYTGDCSLGATGAQIWNYSPSSPKAHDLGSWKKQSISPAGSSSSAILGANFLNGGITFSSRVGGDAFGDEVYLFGGMCPSQTSYADGWQSAAIYSNSMVTLQPSGITNETVNYQLGASSDRGPPVPEAGFTITGLAPTFSNQTDHSQTQQQNFVLLGGHTNAAFINMSQVAMFSLPEQSWTFVNVQQPASTTDTIDSRSGHTAVLTPDGQRIVILGGWVGDVNTPAEPQYAVLEIAEGFGGKGKWQWKVPTTSGAGPPSEYGLYGHGAVMLPGGVLMVTAGYSISPPHMKHKRAAPTVNSQTYFLNVTSNTWAIDYSPPTNPQDFGHIKSLPLSSTGQKAGLGIGLGLALAGICALIFLYMWCRRRSRRQLLVRQKHMQDFAASQEPVSEYYSHSSHGRNRNSDALDDFNGQIDSYFFSPGSRSGEGRRSLHDAEAERSGLLLDVPSPTRGLRHSLGNRPGYTMGRVRGPGYIHPIDELEEELDEELADDAGYLRKHSEMIENRSEHSPSILMTAPTLDPFSDVYGHRNERASPYHSTARSSGSNELSEFDHNPAEWSLHDATQSDINTPSPNGRLSPDKHASDRTSSNLSEKSSRSGFSWASSGIIVRTGSVGATAVLSNNTYSNPFNTLNVSPVRERAGKGGEGSAQSAIDYRTRSLTGVRDDGFTEADLCNTPRSSFAQLQAEGEALLGGKPENTRPDASSSDWNTFHDTECSNSRAATATSATSNALDLMSLSRPVTRERRKSWLVSVRKALTRSVSSAERTRSLTTAMSQHEPYADNPVPIIQTPSEENSKSFADSASPPRRAASDASFWRNRRGQQDWLDEEADPKWRRTAGDDWGTPEDIAMACKERQRREWRQRGSLLIDVSNDVVPPPLSPIRPDQLGVPSADDRPYTPASEVDWDVEAAVERRVVQVMFTVPRSKLRVVNADIDRTSILSLPRENTREGEDDKEEGGDFPTRAKDLVEKFEQLATPRYGSPRPSPSPSPSVKSLKVRAKVSSTSLALSERKRRASERLPFIKGQCRGDDDG